MLFRSLGAGVTLVNSGREAACTAGRFLAEKGLLSPKKAGGSRRYFVTDAGGSFSAVAEVFLGEPVEEVIPVKIGDLEKLAL